MAKKWSSAVIVLTVFCVAGWQICKMTTQKRPEVLAESTTKTLEDRVKSLENRVYVLEKNAGLTTSSTAGKAKESFVLLSGGDISSVEWTKISGTDFTLDTSLYGKTVEVSWQGWIEGTGSVRLYDATNHRAVDFSDFSSIGSEKKSFYSKALSIWRGQNQYYIEGRTSDGTVSLSSPRLKLVVK